MKRRLVLELLDVIQFATPSIAKLDLELTAKKISHFKKKGTPKSYNIAFDLLPKIATGLIKRQDVIAYLNTHPIADWRPFVEDVGIRLYEIFSEIECSWYPTGRKPIQTFSDVWTKPAIRGVAVSKGEARPCLINPRASLYLGNDNNLSFIARGVHELHVIDDVQATGTLIIDLGKHPATKLRENRVHYSEEIEMISLDEFESILRRFVEAVKLAGFNVTPDSIYTVGDLFRKPN
jgi:hypothetical protein